MLLIAVLLCFIGFSVADSNEYDDTTARYKYFPLFSAAFINTPQKCLDNTWPTMKIHNIISIRNCSASIYPQTHCFMYSSVNQAEKIIAITFRGTDTSVQMSEEIMSYFVTHMPFFDSGNVYAYFYEAFLKIWSSGLSNDVRTLKYLYPDYTFYITGHSLGASMASIAASYIVKIGLYKPEQIKLMTFGQPRTGDKAFADWHDQTFPYSFRVVHHKDVVPHIPPQIDLVFKNTLQHHKTEVWYNNNMTIGDPYSVCKHDDGLHCSNLNVDDRWSDHMNYFNHDLNTWPEQHCPKDF